MLLVFFLGAVSVVAIAHILAVKEIDDSRSPRAVQITLAALAICFLIFASAHEILQATAEILEHLPK